MSDPDREPASPTPPNAGPELPRWARTAPSGGVLTEERLAAYVGPKWEKVYRRKLAPFLEDPAFVPTWNWSAALAFPPAWFLYRKLYLPFAIFFLVPGLAFRLLTGSDAPQTRAELLKPENAWLMSMTMAVWASTALAAGGTANWFLFRRARAASRFAVMQQMPPAEEAALIRRMGGVNRIATALFVTLSLVLTMAQLGG
jgi:hypothetical protein